MVLVFGILAIILLTYGSQLFWRDPPDNPNNDKRVAVKIIRRVLCVAFALIFGTFCAIVAVVAAVI